MTVVRAHVKKWGNSMGIIIPNDVIKKNKLKDGTAIEVILLPDSAPTLKRMYGAMPGLRGQKEKDRLRRELYG